VTHDVTIQAKPVVHGHGQGTRYRWSCWCGKTGPWTWYEPGAKIGGANHARRANAAAVDIAVEEHW